MKKYFNFLAACLLTSLAFAQGFFIEYKITSTTGQGGLTGSMKTYAQDGNSRVEMNMNVTGMGGMNMASLYLKSSPGLVYLLNEQGKTYSELSTTTDEDWKDYPQSEYEVTVIGKEKVNGYNATHVKIRRKGSTHDMEMWNTTELPGYADYANLKTKFTGKSNLLKALEAKGATGFPVRIRSAEKQYSMQMDLVKAEKRSNPANLFSLSGYTKGAAGHGSGTNINVQEMINNMQNMTPEEREIWLKKLEEQYKPHE